MTRPVVLFYVQHLLGIGHLRRAATLARAMAESGASVTLASGGPPVDDIAAGRARLVQLPPTKAADLSFTELVDENDRPIDDAWRARRRDALLTLYGRTRPDVLIFELFPFGRRQMRFELLPLLDAAAAAKPRPVIVSSVRDILVRQTKPRRYEEMLDLIDRYFDHILVHADPSLISFDQTFPFADRVQDKITYTGYVIDDGSARRDTADGTGEVIVSAGGGAVGMMLLRAAIGARPATGLRDATWRILVGMNMDDAAYQALASDAPPGVVVERARPDFPALLRKCALSISQAGYNTVMETLNAGCRSVVVPFGSGTSESEQTLRARLLAERGALQIVDSAEPTAERLADAVNRAMAATPASTVDLDTDGAEATARAVLRWANQRRA